MKFSDTILVIGFGSIGKRHINNLLQITTSDIVILTKRNDIRNSDFYQFKKNKNRIFISPNYKQCISKNPKIAFITNETSLHIDYAIRLAKQKIHLFIEKPLSNSMDNTSLLNRIVKRNKLFVMIGCNFRFYPPIIKIKNLITKNTVGKVISVQTENSSYLPDWHPNENYVHNYAAREELGGGVTLTQIHELDFLTWIFGNTKSLKSITGKFSSLKVTSDDLCICLLKLKNNILVELHLDYFSKPYYKRIKIRGTKGTLYWNSINNTIKFFPIRSTKWNVIPIHKNYNLTSKSVNRMYVDEIYYFLKCIKNKKSPMNNLDESIAILKTAISIKSN